MPVNRHQNILHALMAAQLNLISSDQLRDFVQRWLGDDRLAISSQLVDSGVITSDQEKLLIALGQTYVDKHAGQVEQSIGTLMTLGSSAAEALMQVENEALQDMLTATIRNSDLGPPVANVRPPRTSLGSTSSTARFSVIRPHAKGGLGEVFVAFDHELNRHVALKEIQGRYAFDDSSRQRFMLEAEITGGLEHPGIVPVYGLGTYEDGRPFYAMRFIKGKSLAEAAEAFHAKHSKRSIDFRGREFHRLLRRLVDVCNSLEYAHVRGILHRDLKPGNIMLGKYGETLIVDWGLAKPVERSENAANDGDEETLRPSSSGDSSHTVMGQAVGTLAYMSPEAAAGHLDNVGIASDVFSLGGTLYFLLTGKVPYQRDGTDLLARIKEGRFQPIAQINDKIPKPLIAICEKAMGFKPEDRYPSAAAFAEDIDYWLADEQISVYPDGPLLSIARFSRKNIGLVSTAVAAGLLLLLISAGFAISISNKNQQLIYALAQAEESRQTAELQQRRADENSQSARQIALTITEIADKQLSGIRGQDGFRERIVQRAYDLYLTTNANQPEDEQIAWELSRLARILANIKALNRDMAEAAKLYEQSLVIQETLKRDDPKYLDFYAETLRDYASFVKVQGEIIKGAALLTKANGVVLKLLQNSPADISLKRTSSTIEMERVGLYLDLLENENALEAATRVETSYLEIIAGEESVDLDYVIAMFGTARRGQALSILGRDDEARVVYTAGIERGREWLEQINDINFRYAFARAVLYFAKDLSSQKPLPDDAEALVDESIMRFEALIKSSTAPSYRYNLAVAHAARAKIKNEENELEIADQELNTSIKMLEELITSTPTANYRSGLAEVYMNGAELQQATGESEQAKRFAEKALAQQQLVCEETPQSLLEQRKFTDYQSRLQALSR